MYLGVDIGGSHISAALIHAHGKEVAIQSHHEKEAAHDLERAELLRRWVDLMNECMAEQAITGIGISIPGAFDYENGIGRYDHGKFVGLNGFNLLNYFQEYLDLAEDTSIRFMNDAEAFAIGEYWMGSVRDTKRALVITLGTGFGASFVFDGVCIKQGEHIPDGGELYHLEFKEGKMADEFFSTRGLVALYESISGQRLANVKLIAQAAKEGNAQAVLCFEQFGRDLAEFLAPFMNKLQIDTLAIGGNIALAMDLFAPSLHAHLGKNFVAVKNTELGSKAPLYGAVYPFINKNIKP